MALALRIWSASSLRGRPPLRPRALAATRPALVRSWMSARFKIPTTRQKIWKNQFAAGTGSVNGLSQGAESPRRHHSVHSKMVTRSFRLRPQPVQTPDHQGIPLPNRIQAPGQFPDGTGRPPETGFLVNAFAVGPPAMRPSGARYPVSLVDTRA